MVCHVFAAFYFEVGANRAKKVSPESALAITQDSR